MIYSFEAFTLSQSIASGSEARADLCRSSEVASGLGDLLSACDFAVIFSNPLAHTHIFKFAKILKSPT